MNGNQKLAQRMFDASVRIENMFWIAGICAAPPSEFEEFVEDELADNKELIEQFPWLKGFTEQGAGAEDILAEFAFKGIDGFFVQLATPTPRDFMADCNGYSFSWGSYRLKWMFCKTLSEIVKRAEVWQKSVVDGQREKAKVEAPALTNGDGK